MKKTAVLPLCMAAGLAFSFVIPAYGSTGPGQKEDPVPNGITQEQWDRLNDQTIEFDELSDLVRYFNPGIQNTTDTVYDSLGNQRYIQNEMKRYIMDLNDEADELKNSGAADTSQGMEQYMILSQTVKSMKASAEKMGRSLDYMDRSNSSVQSNITQAVKSDTYYANQVMISYNSALANRNTLLKAAELSNAALETQKLSIKQGVSTETDVLSAQKEVQSAQSSLLKLDQTIDSLRSSLCLMTGYSEDTPPAIGDLPVLDTGTVSAISLEADTAKAIGNNYNLISERHTASNHSTTGMNNKKAIVSEGEQNVAIAMQSCYQALLQEKNAYEAACTAYEKAVLEKEKADRSYQIGILSKIGHIQAQLSYLKAESAKQNAYGSLYQAYDTYQWAVNGVIMK
nr:TolC family protein [uncultured Clostridium sp.]